MSIVIHNASFMIERDHEEAFVEWLRAEIGARFRFDAPEGPCAPQLSAMREAAGVDYRQAEAQTVAFQTEFADIEAARRWSAGKFASLAAAFEERFGPNAMVFTSIFERL